MHQLQSKTRTYKNHHTAKNVFENLKFIWKFWLKVLRDHQKNKNFHISACSISNDPPETTDHQFEIRFEYGQSYRPKTVKKNYKMAEIRILQGFWS